MTSPDTFFIFSKFWLCRLLAGWGGGKRAKKWPKMTENSLSHSVSQEPYLIWLWFLVKGLKGQKKIHNDIFRCFYFYFFKHNILNIKIFYWPTSTVFLVNSCFSSLSINASQKCWGVPCLHMHVIFQRTLILMAPVQCLK